jgi:hypothetical protein
MSSTPKTYKGVYMILSLKWSDSANALVWWCPNNAGYTTDIDKAGRYTAEQVMQKASYYDNEDTTRAVPLYDVMEGLIGPIRRIVDVTFRYPMTSFDCNACEKEIRHRVSPDYSPASCEHCGNSVCDICSDEGRCREEPIKVRGRFDPEETGA